MSFFLMALTLATHAQLASDKVLVPIRQNTNIHSSDWVVFEHELRVKNPDAYLLAGFQKIQQGNFEGAIEDLTLSIQSSKIATEHAYFYRGVAKYSLGDFKYAEIDFTKSLLINSIMADSYFLRALSKFEMGEYSGACSDFKKTLSPGKALINISHHKVYEAIQQFCENVPVDTTLIEGLAQY